LRPLTLLIPLATMAIRPIPFYGQVNVLTWHNDNARTGLNSQEPVLTPGNVNVSNFGKLFVISVQGKVDAQPLYVSGLEFPNLGRSYNVLYVVTEHDLAYAFDADTGNQLWSVSLLGVNETPSDDRSCGQVTPEIGITATPVIDPAMGRSGTLYAVAMSKDGSGQYHHRLHALDLTTGAEQFGGPAEIQATFPGSGVEGTNGIQVFDPKRHKARPGLALVNGVVYTTWGSHCDQLPYTGWVIGYNAATLAQVSVLNLTPNGSYGGIWTSGAAPPVDAAGNLYFNLGNGTFETTLNANGFPIKADYGNALVKVSTRNGLHVVDYFNISNTVAESNVDQDLGSGGMTLLPFLNDSQGQLRALAVGAGKDQNLYIVDQNNMGKFHANTNAIYQELVRGVNGPVFSTPAWFNGALYYASTIDTLKAFQFANGAFGVSPASQSTLSYDFPGATPSVSANGTANGIVWTALNANPAVLLAYDASDLSQELYNSNQAANGSDHFGVGNKFIVPTVANGKVYVGTTNGVGVFGLKCSYAFAPQNAVMTGSGGAQTISVEATSGCAWTATSNASWLTITSGSSGTGNGTVTYSASANSSSTPRVGTLTIAGQTFTVTQTGPVAQPTSAPLGVSVSPTSGSGSSQTFNVVFWHFNGHQYLDSGQVLVGAAPDGGGQPFCLVHYDSIGNGLYLYGDSGFFLGPVAPGASSNLLENSACAVNTQQTSVSKSGDAVALNLAISFTNAFQGSKNVYLRALGDGFVDTGTVSAGTWQVSSSNPKGITVTPAAGSGSAGLFTATFLDREGFAGQTFGWAQVLFATAPNGGGQSFCLIHYDRTENALWLYGENGTFLGPIALGSAGGALQNNSCSIDGLNSSAVNLASGLRLTLAISFKLAFLGTKNIYLRQRDAVGEDTGFQAAGFWTVTNSGAAAWVRPNAGSASSETFNAVYYHPGGSTNMAWTQMLFAVAPDGGGQPFCLIHYDRAANGLWLYGDSGFFLGPVTPGATSSALHTSACAIDTAASTVNLSGNNLALNVSVTFQGTFHGKTSTYLRAFDNNHQDTGWQQRGAWTIP
jgi:Viral BACON domain